MTKTDFDAFVKRQQTKEQEEGGALNPEQELNQWLGYLGALYKQTEQYLASYIKNGSAEIKYLDIQLNEDFIGAYSARKMLVKIGLSTVVFTPVGTMLIGAKGRVDVQGPVGATRLSLVDKLVTSARQLVQVPVRRVGNPPPDPPSPEAAIQWTWKISMPPPEMKFIELTQDAFFDMIIAVANA
jgi:hypothetical protein